jgi:asparagine synthase (glutamine-hydrolysing)
MCGIAGFISPEKQFTQQQLKDAAGVLQHRGPDAAGFYFSEDNTTGLAHRRLSILDLSTAADQPMHSANGRYCIVFNGEVYNFNELKKELVDNGTSLKTTSDTEVILELFAQKGPACFSLLNGMFAFAIFDKKENQLTLCRDHLGIKPMFYYCGTDGFVFASELKAIKAFKAKKLSINRASVPYFLHLGYIPEPLTVYNDVYKFPSASYVQLTVGNIFINEIQTGLRTFWKPELLINDNVECNEASAKKQLKTLLEDAVQKQLVSDVPIGTFLSGGVDSSLVTAIASKFTNNKIKTFSIAVDNGKYNESSYAKAVAKELNTEHHEFCVTENEVMEMADKLLSAYDEPYADPSAFPTMIVSKLARQEVTVALTGDGGDELFMGYNSYSWAKRLSNPVTPLIRRPLHYASKFMGQRLERAGQMYNYKTAHNLHSHIFSTEQYYFNEFDLKGMLRQPAFDFDAINTLHVPGRKLSGAESQSLWDLKSYLKDELLVKVDRASMQFSLETRVPLLDYRVAEFALNLHPSLKINDKGVMKYLLKEVLYDYLPSEIFNRPKWGFTIPLSKWLRTDMFPLMDKYTSKQVLEKYNFVDSDEVAAIKKTYLGGKDFLYGRLWLITVLHWWLEENQI